MAEGDGGGTPEGAVSKADHDKAIADLKAGHQQELSRVNQEAAGHRVSRNGSLRRTHALETILKAHNIDFSSVTDESVKGLEIEDGKVKGVYEYTAPTASLPKGEGDGGKPPGSSGGGLTMEKLKGMSQEEVNKLPWADVEAAMKAAS